MFNVSERLQRIRRRTPKLLFPAGGLAARFAPGLALLVGETLPDAPPQVAEVVEILLEVDADAGLLKTLILVEAVDGLREGLGLERPGTVDQVGDCLLYTSPSPRD